MRNELFELNTPKGVITINNDNGIGETGDTKNAGYKSYIYFLKPSDFLKLVASGEEFSTSLPRTTFDYAKALLVKGMAMAILYVDVSLTKPVLKVAGHEGRHRCSFLLNFFKYDNLMPVILHAGDDPLPFSLNRWKLEAESSSFQLPLQEENRFYTSNYKFKISDFNNPNTFRNFIQRLPRSLMNIAETNNRFVETLKDMWWSGSVNEYDLAEFFDEALIPMVLRAIKRALKP